jgi:putative Mg2+ transporter-C (MgtC) family protein
MDKVSNIQFIINVFVALGLGAIIGFERQWRQRMAGLRTNALVAAGAALFALLAQSIPNDGDLTKIPSYIVSGVGFLGAGVIMKEGGSIRGLNTAATLWCSAAVGCLAGFGLYFFSVIGAVAVLSSHFLLRPIAEKINQHSIGAVEHEFKYLMEITCRDDEEAHVRSLILHAVGPSTLILRGLHSENLSENLNSSHKVRVRAEVDSQSKNNTLLEQVVSRLCLEKGVTTASWSLAKEEAT